MARDSRAQVPVASYGYRHEAEFAAGFLDDAGIPYRLQLDDPALGTSVAMRATIWVLSSDVDRVTEVLELDDGRGGRRLTAAAAPTRQMPASRRPDHTVGWPRLDVRERLAAGVVAAGLIGASTVLGGVSLGPESAVMAGILVVSTALAGRAPRPFKAVLAALTGGEP